ncbi:MAG: hypothetical protein QF412_00020 [Planctomycetota bacterium]|nr:hypothetical protein [Planctomycetota bacterium]
MRKTLASIFALVLVAALPAQKDTIYWADGTTVAKVRIISFTWTEIKWTKSGRSESRSADQVARVDCEKVKDAYRRGYGASDDDEAYSQFRMEREKQVKSKKLFIAQFGFMEEANLLMGNKETGECFATLELMTKECPDSGFCPELYRMKLEYYLSLGKKGAANALKVASTYLNTAQTKAWPDGFLHEARFFGLMAEVAGGKMSEDKLKSGLRGLLGDTEGVYPRVANQVKLQVADQQRRQGETAASKKSYKELADQDGLDESTRAGALLGLGQAQLEEGNATDREPYRDALLSFLRVYIEAEKAPSDMRAKALYFASQACEKWRGQDSAAMGRRLRGYLKRDFPGSEWAKR